MEQSPLSMFLVCVQSVIQLMITGALNEELLETSYNELEIYQD